VPNGPTRKGNLPLRFLTLGILTCAALPLSYAKDAGWVRLFNGKDLTGWQMLDKAGPGYIVRDGVLVAPADGGGRLLTEKQYSDFKLRFEFKVDKAGNNGVALRAPLTGDAAYVGMECQILDDYDPMYANLEPGQYCGSIYKVVPAKRGATKPAGQWNTEEITAVGRQVTVKINGKTVVKADLNTVTDPSIIAEHPGFLRPSGYIGFLGHGPSEVQFRNIAIQDLSKPAKDNVPPKGFTALFNGRDLTGWKGLVGNPISRSQMSPAELLHRTEKATEEARLHWLVQGGEIVYDGKNDNLCTEKDYGDFELWVDWKIEPDGDSGIYLRGSPQVQIWDNPIGSGGLYNNEKNPSRPEVFADNPPGQWNTFRILMLGPKVTVFLNDKLVVQNVTMENYWDRSQPIFPTGAIELQHHGSVLHFKNIYVRPLPRKGETP
jgi:hypothetical protein